MIKVFLTFSLVLAIIIEGGDALTSLFRLSSSTPKGSSSTQWKNNKPFPFHNNNNNNNNNNKIEKIFLIDSGLKDSSVEGSSKLLLMTMTTSSVRTSLSQKLVAFTTTVLACYFSVMLICPLNAVGETTTPATTLEAVVFNHEYTDPIHPACIRKIVVKKDGKTVEYSGTYTGSKTDPVPRGCSYSEIKEYGIQRDKYIGQILPTGLQLDNGNGMHIGTWEEASNSITWDDGTKWTVKVKPLSLVIGEYFFLAYIGVSTLAGFKGLYDGIQRKRQEAR
jgi:hypothetical protein